MCKIYINSLKAIWWFGVGINVLGFFLVGVERGVELSTELKTEYGLEDGEKRAPSRGHGGDVGN